MREFYVGLVLGVREIAKRGCLASLLRLALLNLRYNSALY